MEEKIAFLSGKLKEVESYKTEEAARYIINSLKCSTSLLSSETTSQSLILRPKLKLYLKKNLLIIMNNLKKMSATTRVSRLRS